MRYATKAEWARAMAQEREADAQRLRRRRPGRAWLPTSDLQRRALEDAARFRRLAARYAEAGL